MSKINIRDLDLYQDEDFFPRKEKIKKKKKIQQEDDIYNKPQHPRKNENSKPF
jgi:hypothetical protein